MCLLVSVKLYEGVRMQEGRREVGVWWRVGVVGMLCTLGFPGLLEAQQPTLTPDGYGQFERLGAFELDPLGDWLVSTITRVDGSSELRLAPASAAGTAIVIPHGRTPIFSADGRWLAYRKGVSQDESEAAEDPIQDRLGLVNLESATDTVLFDISSFAFRDDGTWLAARGVPSADSVGGNLIVMDPMTGEHTVIGNVDLFSWQDEGMLLAATLKTAWGSSNGVVLFDPEGGTLRTLDSGDAEYAALAWRDESSQLGVLRSVERDDYEEVSHDLLVWDDVRSSSVQALDAIEHAGIPADTRITDYSGLRFSESGRTVFVGLRPWEGSGDADEDQESGDDDSEGEAQDSEDEDHDDTKDEVGPADVQVWHWDDDQVLRAQEYRSGQISRQTNLAAWNLDEDRLVVLGDDLEESVRIVAGGQWGLVGDYDPYLFERRFGAGTADWYRVDVETGERIAFADRVDFGAQSHADLAHVLVYKDERWTAIDMSNLERAVLGDGRSFTQSLSDHDYPGSRPTWGVGGWSSDGEWALLYDKHDIWRADLSDGALSQVTDGASAGEQYRVANIDPDQSAFGPALLDSDDDLWLSVRHLTTKASGYVRTTDSGQERARISMDARVTGLRKARNSDRFALRVERWEDSPDVFVGGDDLSDLTQVTQTNPFQAEFAWGHSELLDYTTDAGHDLQAILVYPADFQEGRQYPLILYQYERLSDNLHSYDVPGERDYYNYQAWSQEGYFVLMPDIVYQPGRPGPSALDAVEHALDAAVATGHVDADGMGLIGHSWGGYQASYLPTRTDRFAASVAGAAITNFMSFMGAVHWNGGLPEVGHWETGQARMASPYWEDLKGHLESSPANFIMDLNTPIMLMHGDADGVVDFYQGLEFYNYARRAGKEVVLLVYPGADHGLSEETQQVDYHRRILEWFGHHLRGDPAPAWITDGETWPERAKRIGR